MSQRMPAKIRRHSGNFQQGPMTVIHGFVWSPGKNRQNVRRNFEPLSNSPVNVLKRHLSPTALEVTREEQWRCALQIDASLMTSQRLARRAAGGRARVLANQAIVGRPCADRRVLTVKIFLGRETLVKVRQNSANSFNSGKITPKRVQILAKTRQQNFSNISQKAGKCSTECL